MRNYKVVVLLLVLVVALNVQNAMAFPTILNDFRTKYPDIVGSRIDSCLICHVNANPSLDDPQRNSYGIALNAANYQFSAIEQLDSDGDGFKNIDEINNLTFPGNSSDFPAIAVEGLFNIHGFKINESSGNGIAGWNITLSNATMQVNDTTEVDGQYHFHQLINGTYTVTEEMKNGFTNVTPTSVQVIINGNDVEGINFTNRPVAAVTTGNFAADQIGGEEVPAVDSMARGNAVFVLDGNEIRFRVEVANITNVTASHIHLAPFGVAGPIVVPLFLGPTKVGRFDGVLAEGKIEAENLTGPLEGMPFSALIDNMTAGNTYVNVHTTANPSGEIRGQIKVKAAPDMRFSISGFKKDDDGIGIKNWTIMLKNGTTDNIIDTMLTKSDGSYKFTILANGTYNVTEENKEGFTPSGDIFKVVNINGQNIVGINFTNIPSGPEEKETFNVSGFKINQNTGNGIKNWNITIANDTMQTSMLTGLDGSYKFEHLVNDTYTVSEEMKGGFTNVTPTSLNVTIVGGDISGINFTNVPIIIRNFTADLKGSEEVPPVSTFATGKAIFSLNNGVLKFKVNVTNITNATLSHIHLAPFGVAGPIVVPLFLGPTKSGRFDGVLAEGEIRAENLTGPLVGMPFEALIDNMTAGNTYINVHTTQHPGGEIRGQITLVKQLAEIKEFTTGDGNRAGSILANVTITNLDTGVHTFVVVVGGTDPLSGFPLVGTGTVRLDANQTLRMPVLISVPASTKPGQFDLFAGAFPFDEEILDPTALIGKLVGPETSTVS